MAAGGSGSWLLALAALNLVCGMDGGAPSHSDRADEVRRMFTHGYDSYMHHAYPKDELCPLTCTGKDTWGSYALTLVDALDTLYLLENYTEFDRAVAEVAVKVDLALNRNVSVFETNIRILGGLISAHIFATTREELRAAAAGAAGGVEGGGAKGGGGPRYSGAMLEMAVDLGERLLPAFDTPTGIPYGTVNLLHGVPPGETTVTSLAGAGTYLIEFGMLTRLTDDRRYQDAARGAMRALWARRSGIGLVGNHIDIRTGKWVYRDSGIGPNQDSFYEYLLKAYILFGDPEYLAMFDDFYVAINTYMKKEDWYVDVNMDKGQVSLPWFTALGGFWPGLQVLYGDIAAASRTMVSFQKVWRKYGFAPEAVDLSSGNIVPKLGKYFLRPEMTESTMYLARATKDPLWFDIGNEYMQSIQYSAWTPCGYAIVNNVTTHQLGDRMESFFLSETLKYLYLIFDQDNLIHRGNYVFSTEAHPYEVTRLTRDSRFWVAGEAQHVPRSCRSDPSLSGCQPDRAGPQSPRTPRATAAGACPRKGYATKVASYHIGGQVAEPIRAPRSAPSLPPQTAMLNFSMDSPPPGVDMAIIVAAVAKNMKVDSQTVVDIFAKAGTQFQLPQELAGAAGASGAVTAFIGSPPAAPDNSALALKNLIGLVGKCFEITGSAAKSYWSYEACFGQSVVQFKEKERPATEISLGFPHYGRQLRSVPFNKAQALVDGVDNHRLFNGEGVARDSYVQQFTGGAFCTNAEDQPTQRSAEVTFVCCPNTKENHFRFSVKEPRLCQYAIHIHTPLACHLRQRKTRL